MQINRRTVLSYLASIPFVGLAGKTNAYRENNFSVSPTEHSVITASDSYHEIVREKQHLKRPILLDN